MDPRNKQVNIELQSRTKRSGEAIEMKTVKSANNEKFNGGYKTYHDPKLQPRRKQLQNKPQRPISKEQAVRKLIYDESDLTEVQLNSLTNPCFVND